LRNGPEDRWQHADDLARELEALARGVAVITSAGAVHQERPRKRWLESTVTSAVVLGALSLAAVTWRRQPEAAVRTVTVLPCRASESSEAKAYCDGLAETLNAKLAPLALAHGVQMTSTYEVRQRRVSNAAEAHKNLGATLVVEGSVFRAGNELRVTYALVDATTLKQVDGDSFVASANDPFALQDRVAAWAVDALALKLDAPERQSLTARATDVPTAHDYNLQGRGYLLDYQKESNVDAAVGLFKRALTEDPRYALAYAGLGQAYWRKYELTHDRIWVEQARSSCDQAITKSSRSSAAHVCRGNVHLGTGEFADSAREFEAALEIEPTSDEAYLGLAQAFDRQGKTREAEATFRRAVTLQPRYWAARVRLGTFYRDHARYEEAAAQYQYAVTLTPDNPGAHFILGGLYIYLGRYRDAVSELRQSIALGPTTAAYSNLGMTYYRMRDFDAATAMLEAARRLDPSNVRTVANLARAYYWQGDHPKETIPRGTAIDSRKQSPQSARRAAIPLPGSAIGPSTSRASRRPGRTSDFQAAGLRRLSPSWIRWRRPRHQRRTQPASTKCTRMRCSRAPSARNTN
jgi:tetratricopeptide (TPR) repeat protein